MRSIYIKSILTLFFVIITHGMYSQNYVSYNYDQAGNRISRKIIYVSTPQSVKNNNQKADSIATQDMIGDREIKIYPNPTKGWLGIEINGGQECDINMWLYNANGSMILHQKLVEGYNSLDMTICAPGWYIMKILSGEEKTEYKIIKQ